MRVIQVHFIGLGLIFGLVGLGLSSWGAGSDQTGQIEGRVLERGTRQVIADQNVFLLPTRDRVTTDSSGRFRFAAAPSGSNQILVNIAGFQRLERSIEVQPGQTTRIDLFVERLVYSGFETTVEAVRRNRDDQTRTLRQQDFLTAPGAGGDPIKAVQNLPGIARTGGANARIVIQGAEPEDTRYFLNDHEIPLVFHFGGLSSVVFPEAVERVSLLPAGFGPEFGRAIGGQVGLTTRAPRRDRLGGIGFVDIFNVGAMAEGPIGEAGAFLVGARYSYVGEVIRVVAERMTEDFGLTVAPTFADVTLLYKKPLGDDQEFQLTGLASRDVLEFVLKNPPNEDPGLRGRFYNETAFYRLVPEWTRRWGSDQTLKASLGAGQNAITFDVGDNFFRLKSNLLTVRSDLERRLSPRWTTAVGVDNQYNWFNLDLRLPTFAGEGGVNNPISVGSSREVTTSGTALTIGLYNRHEVRLGESWTLIPGLRLDWYRPTRELLPQPRLALRYRFSDALLLRSAGGLYFQPPSGQQSSDSFGNPAINSPLAWHLNSGVDWDLRAGSTSGSVWSFGVFYKALERLITRSQAQIERDGQTVPEYFANSGIGQILGSEVSWRYQAAEWSVGLNYTLSQSRRREPGQIWYPSEFDQTHNLNVLGSYQKERWLLTGRFRYVTGSPFTPVTGSSYDADQGVYIPIRGAYFSERRPAFTQADVRAEYKWIFDTWILTSYFDIQNILNQKNVEGVNYSFDYRERRDIVGLGVLPTFGVKGEF